MFVILAKHFGKKAVHKMFVKLTEGFNNPPDYNDMEGFCGGFEVGIFSI